MDVQDNCSSDSPQERPPFSLVSSVTVFGESNVGKTSLILSYINSPPLNQPGTTQRSTIGVENSCLKQIKLPISNQTINLHIFDAGGLKRFRNVVLSYLKQGRIFFIVFDLCNEDTFKSAVTYWMRVIKENCKCTLDECLVYLIGTKCEVEQYREVSHERAQIFADQFGIKYFEVSAFSGHNVDNLFQVLYADIDNVKAIKIIYRMY